MSAVPIRTRAGPVNRSLAAATVAGVAAWWLWPEASDEWQRTLLSGIAGACAVGSGIEGIAHLVRDYRLRRDVARAAEPTSAHGTAREATWEELRARRMDDPASGNFLGLYQGAHPLFAPADASFGLVEMPPGGGKTSRIVLGSILHQAHIGRSVIVTDPKQELAPMLAPALRDLGFEVWCVDPVGRFTERCGNVELNPYQAVLDAVYAADETRKDAIKRAADLAMLHLPEKDGDDKNLYFRQGSRRCITFAILYLALTDPARCTPADVFALMNDAGAFVRALRSAQRHLETAIPNDPLVAFVKTESSNLLHRKKHNGENFASFLEGGTQPLLPFNQGSRLAGYGRTADRNIADVRGRQVIVFLMTPLSHARDFGPLISLQIYNLIAACKDHPAGRRVHIVGEEALNVRFADLVSDLETMRGLGVTADFYVQSYAGLVRKYGREAAEAVESYAAVKLYSAINSYARAKHVSDMLAEATIAKQDYSFRSAATDLGISGREMGRRLMTPDEVMAMPRGQAWLFVQGLRPVRLTLAHYGQIDPWRDLAGENPVEGGRLYEAPLFSIRYPTRGGE